MKKHLLLGIVTGVAVLASIGVVLSDSNGKLGHAGAPNENSCSESGCHGAGSGGLADNAGPGNISISCSNMPGWTYTPGMTYHFTVTVTQAACNLFGFSAVCVNSGNGNAGTMVVTDNVHTRMGTPYGITKNYITHTGLSSPAPGTATTTNPAVFNYDWTAPSGNMGPVRIFFNGLAANNDHLENGPDNVYSGMQLINPAAAVSSPLIMSTLNPGSSFPFYLRTTTGTPSVAQSFDVAGLALTGNLNISVPSPFELSTSQFSGFATTAIPLPPSAGAVPATKIWIRYNPSLGGSTTATITASSAGGTSQLGYANGAIATPNITVPVPASLPTFTTTAGTPSAIDSFVVSSSGLVDNLVITAPAQFQISMHRYSAYVNSESAPIFIPTWGYSGMKVYVRYNPSVGGTHTGNVTIASTGATTRNVAVTGISSALGIEEELTENSIGLYPNPTTESAMMRFSLSENKHLKISLKNIEGKEIRLISEQQFSTGNNVVKIDCSGLAKGLYFVAIISSGDDRIYKKLIVQ